MANNSPNLTRGVYTFTSCYPRMKCHSLSTNKVLILKINENQGRVLTITHMGRTIRVPGWRLEIRDRFVRLPGKQMTTTPRGWQQIQQTSYAIDEISLELDCVRGSRDYFVQRLSVNDYFEANEAIAPGLEWRIRYHTLTVSTPSTRWHMHGGGH